MKEITNADQATRIKCTQCGSDDDWGQSDELNKMDCMECGNTQQI